MEIKYRIICLDMMSEDRVSMRLQEIGYKPMERKEESSIPNLEHVVNVKPIPMSEEEDFAGRMLEGMRRQAPDLFPPIRPTMQVLNMPPIQPITNEFMMFLSAEQYRMLGRPSLLSIIKFNMKVVNERKVDVHGNSNKVES